MILDNSNKSITVVLAGAKNTSDANCFASWEDSAPAGANLPSAGVVNRGSAGINTNGTNVVTVVPAPTSVAPLSSSGITSNGRKITLLTIYNADIVSITATVSMLNGSTTSIIGVFVLSVGDTLSYVDGRGFSVQSSTGAVRQASSPNAAALRQNVIVPLQLSDISTGAFTIAVPFAFTIISALFRTAKPASTSAKAATLTLSTNLGSLTGGVMALSSANQATTGGTVAATAISGLNASNVAGGTIIATGSSVTAFVEGDGWIEVTVSNNS